MARFGNWRVGPSRFALERVRRTPGAPRRARNLRPVLIGAVGLSVLLVAWTIVLPRSDVYAGEYVATSVQDGGFPRPLLDETQLTLSLGVLLLGPLALDAHAGCQRISGSAAIVDGRLHVLGEGLTSGTWLCSSDGTEVGSYRESAQAAWFADFLESGPLVVADEHRLLLDGGHDRVELRRLP